MTTHELLALTFFALALVCVAMTVTHPALGLAGCCWCVTIVCRLAHLSPVRRF